MIWHSSQIKSVLEELSVDENNGLANGVAYERLETNGKNQISEIRPVGFLRRFLGQLNRKSVYALVIISVVCLIFSLVYNRNDFSPILIIAIVILNALLTAYHQSVCDRAVFVQKTAAIPTCTVIREGIKRNIPSNELVVGDIILLSEGDYICADARLIETNAFRCNELALTGENIPVEKDASALLEDIVPFAGRKNMVFSGTNVIHGTAKAVVVETGLNTEIGKSDIVGKQISNSVSGFSVIEKTINATARVINITVIVFCAIAFLIGMLLNISTTEPFASITVRTLLSTVALGICAVPESLPMITVLVTALGTGRLIHDGIIIKNTSALETLAKTTVLCADKTGVFTKKHMLLNSVYNGEAIEKPSGEQIDPKSAVVLRLAVACSMLENDSTEAAIEDACLKYNKMSKADIDNVYPRLNTIPFDSERKMMTSINMIDGKPFAVIKGAPETVLDKCTGIDVQALNKTCEKLAGKALRLICIAIKALDEIPANPDAEVIERDLKFAGIICLEDPPRSEAAESIEFCKNSGIKVLMLTGDNITTARAVARNLDILSDDNEAITGAELEEMDDDELKEKIGLYTVFARISPAQKLRIVDTLKSVGNTVTVTGNGLDDADVLSIADVGVAIGNTGNDVARGNADAIVKKNDFSSVVKVFKECHGLLDNIKKSVHYLVSCNFSELLIYIIGLLIFKMPPLLAVQLLWINLLTDAAPAISLAIQPAGDFTVSSASRLIKGKLFDVKTITEILIEAITLTVCGVVAFAIGNSFGISVAYTMTFLTVSLSQIFHSFNLRLKRSIIFTRYKRNEFMCISSMAMLAICILLALTPAGYVFGMKSLTASQFFISFALSLVIIPVCEIVKRFNKE